MRTAKQQAKLDVMEEEFRAKLIAALTAAAQDTYSQLFRSEIHNPYPELRGHTDPTTNRLLEQAQEIIGLRAQLGEWPEESLAAKFVAYCERFNNLDDPHRLGVQKHAQALLNEVEI